MQDGSTLCVPVVRSSFFAAVLLLCSAGPSLSSKAYACVPEDVTIEGLILVQSIAAVSSTAPSSVAVSVVRSPALAGSRLASPRHRESNAGAEDEGVHAIVGPLPRGASQLAIGRVVSAGASGKPQIIVAIVILLVVALLVSTNSSGSHRASQSDAQKLEQGNGGRSQANSEVGTHLAGSSMSVASSMASSKASRGSKRVSFREESTAQGIPTGLTPYSIPALPPTAGKHTKPGSMCWVPAICHSLILHNSRIVFRLEIDELLTLTDGVLDITGPKGKSVLLRAFAGNDSQGRRCITLGSARDNFAPCVKVAVPSDGGNLEVYGRGKDLFGTVESTSSSWTNLICKGRPAISVEHPDLASLQMLVSLPAGNGETAAMAKREVIDDSEFFVVVVQPGMDAVLITACLLSIVLLTPLLGNSSASESVSIDTSQT